MVADPPTPTVPKLSLQHPPTINQPNISRTSPKVTIPSPAQTPIRVGQTRIQIQPTLAMLPINILTLSDQRAALVF